MSDLDVLYPAGKEVMAGGETLTIKPFAFGQIPKATKLMAPITKIMQGSQAVRSGSILDWVQLLAEGGDDLLAFLAWAINKPRDWFDTIAADEGIAVLTAVYEVNADFFSRKVLPLLGLVAPAPLTDGATPSPSSSQPGTADATLTPTP